MNARRIIWLWAALVALLAGSCVKTQGPEENGTGGDGWTPLNGDTPITFSTSLTDRTTKTTSLSSVCTSFRVFAFYQPGENGNPGTWADLRTKNWTPNFMYNQQVNWVTDHWEYTPVKYWPNNLENTITFWAYAPADATVTFYQSGTATLYNNTTPGIPGVMLTVPASANTDFMLSKFDMVKDHSLDPDYPTFFTQDLSKPSLGDGVNFLFYHALCKVNFKIAKADDPDNLYEITVNSVRLKNILFTGVQTGDGWAAGSSTRSDFVALSSPISDLPSSPAQTLPTSGILMPQRLSRTTATLYVQYVCTNRSTSVSTTYDCEVPLGDVQSSWDPSMEYTFNIRITPGNPILFTADVVKWESDTNGYFNVD